MIKFVTPLNVSIIQTELDTTNSVNILSEVHKENNSFITNWIPYSYV